MDSSHTQVVPAGLDPLHVVLEHLSGPDGNHLQYRIAARGLRLASKHYNAVARATLRQLLLYKHWNGVQSAYPDPGNRPLLPWSLLAAHPNATSWQIYIQQLEGLTPDEERQLAAAAGGLRQLVVYERHGHINGCERSDVFFGDPSDEQLETLGRLLRASPRLEEVELYCTVNKPWLVLDPNSSSLSTATAPHLVLRSWESARVPHTLVTRWVEQQQGLTDTLHTVHLRRAGPKLDACDLATLRGLKELKLEDDSLVSPTHLTRMTSVTGLHLICSASTARAACMMTGLQDLKLFWSVDNMRPPFPSPPPLGALKQLTSFKIRYGHEDQERVLVEQLPSLEAWDASYLPTTGVPSSLTRLSRLFLDDDWEPGELTLNLPASLTRMKELSIRPHRYTAIVGLSNLTGLERLVLSTFHGSASASAASILAALQPLTLLRHLSFGFWSLGDVSQVTVLGALQRLTYLSMGYSPPINSTRGDDAEASPASQQWLLSEPLPALQQLHMFRFRLVCSLSAMSHWLVRLTALTSLSTQECVVEGNDGQLRLPVQLEKLQLERIADACLGLPCCLMQLSSLRILGVSYRRGVVVLRELPSWLSQLRHLEVLDLFGTGVKTEQPVLAQLPALRHVSLPRKASGVVVYGRATHLHFGDVGCLWEYS